MAECYKTYCGARAVFMGSMNNSNHVAICEEHVVTYREEAIRCGMQSEIFPLPLGDEEWDVMEPKE